MAIRYKIIFLCVGVEETGITKLLQKYLPKIIARKFPQFNDRFKPLQLSFSKAKMIEFLQSIFFITKDDLYICEFSSIFSMIVKPEFYGNIISDNFSRLL